MNKIWGLGIGDWGMGTIPNTQYPIPNYNINNKKFYYELKTT